MAAPSEQEELPFGRKAGARAILEAAERLFGQYGHEGVSIRQVNLAAGMANNSAVAYHFGDKAGLIRAIYEWRLPALESSRTKLVETARAQDRLSEPVALLGIMLRPFYELVDEKGNRTHAMFMYQMMRSAEGRAIRLSLENQSPLSDFAVKRLGKELSNIPQSLLRHRLRLGSLAFLDTICAKDIAVSMLGISIDEESFLIELLDMVAAMCIRPASPKLRAALTAAKSGCGGVKK